MNPSQSGDTTGSGWASPDLDRLFRLLTRVGLALGVPVNRSDIHAVEPAENRAGALADVLQVLRISAQQAGIFLKETDLRTADEVVDLVREGLPVIIARIDGSFLVLERSVGRKLEGSEVGEHVQTRLIKRRELKHVLSSEPPPRTFVAKKELECDSISGVPGHDNGHEHHGGRLPPLRRFLGLLSFDRRDIGSVILFAFVAGILALATPLAVESLVNVVSWGTYFQPLIVLGLMLLICLGLAGVMKVLQTVVVEMIHAASSFGS